MERFWSKVNKTNNCWEWTAGKNSKGYGVFQRGRGIGTILAHRYSFYLTNSYYPKLVLHSCDNPSCVNPEHLSDGTHSENIKQAWDRLRTRTTHCPQGHLYEGSNIYLTTTGRTCRICHNERNKLRKRRIREMDEFLSDDIRN
jgi:hypothetical protein